MRKINLGIKLGVSLGFMLAFFFSAHLALAERGKIWLQTTTSVENSGLMDYLLPRFTQETGIAVKLIALGTGQALENARRGDADVVITHAVALEKEFIREGYADARNIFMTNDFVLVGPISDPAKIGDCQGSMRQALSKILDNGGVFLSRGDNSGTHVRELSLWHEYAINPFEFPKSYKETGAGMGATLMIANEIEAYTIADRGTFYYYHHKNGMKIICVNQPPLYNYYAVMVVNRDKIPSVNEADAQVFAQWLQTEVTQGLIDAYRIQGNKLFHSYHE